MKQKYTLSAQTETDLRTILEIFDQRIYELGEGVEARTLKGLREGLLEHLG